MEHIKQKKINLFLSYVNFFKKTLIWTVTKSGTYAYLVLCHANAKEEEL